VRFFLR